MHTIAEVLLHRGPDLLLVQQQKPEDPEPYWTLPGGLVGPEELATEAAARETFEETGITIRHIDGFVYVSQTYGVSRAERVVVFCFESSAWHGEVVCEDPDRVVTEARFFSRPDAIGALESPHRQGTRGLRMTEPLVAYLNGSVESRTLWFYREGPEGKRETIGNPPKAG